MQDRKINTVDVAAAREHMRTLSRKISAAVAQGIN
jgi:hypothetical protein